MTFSAGLLSDRTFSLSGRNYTIDAIYIDPGPHRRTLYFQLDDGLWLRDMENLMLEVDGVRSYDFVDARFEFGESYASYWYQNLPQGWTGHQCKPETPALQLQANGINVDPRLHPRDPRLGVHHRALGRAQRLPGRDRRLRSRFRPTAQLERSGRQHRKRPQGVYGPQSHRRGTAVLPGHAGQFRRLGVGDPQPPGSRGPVLLPGHHDGWGVRSNRGDQVVLGMVLNSRRFAAGHPYRGRG